MIPGSTSEGVREVLRKMGVLTGCVIELATPAGNCFGAAGDLQGNV